MTTAVRDGQPGKSSRRGIAFHPQRKVVRVDAGARRIVFEDGSDAACDLLIAIPPHEAPKVVRDAGLVGPSGWIPADPRTLRVVGAGGAAEVFAIGDVAAVPLPGRFRPDAPLSLPKAGVWRSSGKSWRTDRARVLDRAARRSTERVLLPEVGAALGLTAASSRCLTRSCSAGPRRSAASRQADWSRASSGRFVQTGCGRRRRGGARRRRLVL
jgi:hypothetical protein